MAENYETNLTIAGNLTIETPEGQAIENKIIGTLEKLDLTKTILDPLISSAKIQSLDTNKLVNSNPLFIGDVSETSLSDRTNLKAKLINITDNTDDNLILEKGQIAFEKVDTNYRCKIGDGITKYSELRYDVKYKYANLGLTKEEIAEDLVLSRLVVVNALKTSYSGLDPKTGNNRGQNGEGTPEELGLTKLYDTVTDNNGNNTDGTLTQMGINQLVNTTVGTINQSIDNVKSELNTNIDNLDTRTTNSINAINANIATITTDVTGLQLKTVNLSDDGLTFSGKANECNIADKATNDSEGNKIIDTYVVKSTLDNYYTKNDIDSRIGFDTTGLLLNVNNVKVFNDVSGSFTLPGIASNIYLVIYTVYKYVDPSNYNPGPAIYSIMYGGNTISGYSNNDKLSGTYIKLK